LNYERKALRDKQIQNRIKEQARKESAEQRKVIAQIIVVLIILSALLLFGLLQYRSKMQSQKKLELLNDELRHTNVELGESKQVIETQHKEITDSLNYAQQIQLAILPKSEDLKTVFPESFVLYFPKETIGGDFYWVTQLDNLKIIVVADGTGHGVPGGFLTMLGVSMLNELVIEQKITSPSELLNQMRSKVISSLKQTVNEGEHKDGFDMSICVFNGENRMLTYALANQSILLQKENELIVLKGDRFPVGLHGEELHPFNEFTVELDSGNYIYLMTDGFSDQFGGEHGKKYKSKNLQNFISSLGTSSTLERSDALKKEFYTWKGTYAQTDDVTLYGFKID
jgi:serine phosphatase RsbU (regulator of sigma subunit)